jgi:hypothetical protein
MLTGSEKQIKWCEEILKEAYDYLDARYNHKIADEVEKQAVSLVRAEMEKAYCVGALVDWETLKAIREIQEERRLIRYARCLAAGDNEKEAAIALTL